MAKENEVGFLEEQAGAGLENVDITDIALPFLRIAQPLTPQMEKDGDDYIPSLELGMFFNSVTSKVYGKEINLIPLKYERVWIEWKPNRGGYVAQHAPNTIRVDQTDFSRWMYNGNIIQDTMIYYCLIEGHLEDGIIVFPLSSTGIKHGKNWLTQINMTKLPSGNQAPIFSSVWNLRTSKQENEKGKFYQIGGKSTNVSRSRFISNNEYTQFVVGNLEGIKQIGKVDFKQLTDGSNEANVPEPSESATDEKTKVDY